MTEPTDDDRLTDVSTTFDLLSDARRRGVLYALEQNERTTLDTLAERIARWEQKAGRTTAAADDVRTSLVHAHLPRLADADVIEFDPATGTVELTDEIGALRPFLRRTRELDPSIPRLDRSHAIDWASETGD